MFCTQCGKEIPDSNKFCTFCGAPTKLHKETSTVSSTIMNGPIITPSVAETGAQSPAQEEQLSVNQQQVEDQLLVDQQPAEEEPLPVIQSPEEEINQVNQQQTGAQPVNQQPMESQPIYQQPMGQQLMGQQSMGQQPMGQQPMGQQPMGQPPMGQAVNPNYNYYNESNKLQNSNSAKNTPPAKKKSYKIPIIIGICAGVVLIGVLAFFFVYQNHIKSQAVAVIELYDDEEYKKAADIYDKYGKQAVFRNNVNGELIDRAEEIKKDYLNEKLEYETAIEQLNAITDFENKELTKKASEIIDWVNMIYNSRANYTLAKDLYAQGDYQGALEKYKLVVEEDKAYYDLASVEMAEAEEFVKQEELERQEEERVNTLRSGILISAENYEATQDYASAIAAIEQGLIELPGDQILQDRLSYYNSLVSTSVSADDISSQRYEYTYKDNDIDIMTVSIEYPVLSGYNPVYNTINQTFQDLLNYYIQENDQLAESTKEYAAEEYFIASSFDLSYSVQYNDNGILCILMEGYTFSGGVHGYPVRLTFTFDLTTGNQLQLSDLIAAEDNVFWTYVTAEFEKLFIASPEEYWEDALTTVQNAGADINYVSYHLTDYGINIYFFPYDLASYARGFVEVTLPYQGNEWMFAFLNSEIQY